ncbi:hypothetical protein Tco_0859677 [Tanacetum coccineum]|uniref:Uncharacterized protein n=1 Tax=Tanacetum coccineum TaxID=301880 RepID=A0ABQ5BCS3_9ASTR
MSIHHCDSRNQVHIFTNQDGHLFDLSARTQWPQKGLKSGLPTKLWFLLIGLLSLETEGDDAALMSIDSKGTNVPVRQGAQHSKKGMELEKDKGSGESMNVKKPSIWSW